MAFTCGIDVEGAQPLEKINDQKITRDWRKRHGYEFGNSRIASLVLLPSTTKYNVTTVHKPIAKIHAD